MPVCQPCETADRHAHSEVLTLYKRRADVLGVGIAHKHCRLRSDALAGAIARVEGVVAVEFYEHRIIDIHTKSTFDGLCISLEAIGRDLNTRVDARCYILHKGVSPCGATLPYQIAHHEL